MTTVRIKQEFRDKDNFSKVYSVGSICEFENGRALLLIDRGLAEPFLKSVEAKSKRSKNVEE